MQLGGARANLDNTKAANVESSGYYDNINHTLLDLVRTDATRICEFGCGGGALARAVRHKLGSGIHYVGVELMPDALGRASTVLDVAVQCNLDDAADWSSHPLLADALPLAHFDHAIFGDVLEHLYNPKQALQQAAKRLRPGGTVLVCVPNVQHWSVFAQLALGSWPQADAGLFDRTHLRWFTLTDMAALLNEVGLVVEKVVPRVFEAERGRAVMAQLRPLANFLGVDAELLSDKGLPLQYVFVASVA